MSLTTNECEISGANVPPKTQSVVKSQMDFLSIEIDSLEKVIGSIEEKLEPVLQRACAKEEKEQKESIELSPLANTIRHHADRINSANKYLCDIRARIEL